MDGLPWERIFMRLWLYKSVCILYLRDASINRILLIEVSWTDIMDLIVYYIHVAGIDATCTVDINVFVKIIFMREKNYFIKISLIKY